MAPDRTPSAAEIAAERDLDGAGRLAERLRDDPSAWHRAFPELHASAAPAENAVLVAEQTADEAAGHLADVRTDAGRWIAAI